MNSRIGINRSALVKKTGKLDIISSVSGCQLSFGMNNINIINIFFRTRSNGNIILLKKFSYLKKANLAILI